MRAVRRDGAAAAAAAAAAGGGVHLDDRGSSSSSSSSPSTPPRSEEEVQPGPWPSPEPPVTVDALMFLGAQRNWPEFIQDVARLYGATSFDLNGEHPDEPGLGSRESALHMAARRDSLGALEKLIELGGRPNLRSRSGMTVLEVALLSGSNNCAKYLVRRRSWGGGGGSPPNDATIDSDVPPGRCVSLAAAYCDLELVDMLVREGGDPNQRDRSGQIPLNYALWYGTPREVSYFVQFGLAAMHRDNDGDTPLHCLCSRGTCESAGVDDDDVADPLSERDQWRRRRLLTINDFADVASLLLRHGADCNALNDAGTAPLDYCSTNREAAWLLVNGANPPPPSPPPPTTKTTKTTRRRRDYDYEEEMEEESEEEGDRASSDLEDDLAANRYRHRGLKPDLARCLSEIERLGLTTFGFGGMSLLDLLFQDSHELARFATNPKLAYLATGRSDDAFDALTNFPICSHFLARQRDRAQTRRRLLEGASRFLSERALASKLIRPRLHEPLYLDVLRHLGNRQLQLMADAAPPPPATEQEDDESSEREDRGPPTPAAPSEPAPPSSFDEAAAAAAAPAAAPAAAAAASAAANDPYPSCRFLYRAKKK